MDTSTENHQKSPKVRIQGGYACSEARQNTERAELERNIRFQVKYETYLSQNLLQNSLKKEIEGIKPEKRKGSF